MRAKYQKGGKIVNGKYIKSPPTGPDKVKKFIDIVNNPGGAAVRSLDSLLYTMVGKTSPMVKRRADARDKVLNKQAKAKQRNPKPGPNEYQKGGQRVKDSLIYNPTMPNTEGRRGDHSQSKIDAAIARDSTTIANRSDFANIVDWNNAKKSLQTNREYRDTAAKTDPYDRAKKINKMKNKKQSGGSLPTKPAYNQGDWLQTASSKEIKFDKPKGLNISNKRGNVAGPSKNKSTGKKGVNPSYNNKTGLNLKQTGGSYSGSLLDKAKQLRAETKEIGERRSNENKRAYHARLRKMGIDPATLWFDKKGSHGQIMKDSKKASPKNPKPGPNEYQTGGTPDFMLSKSALAERNAKKAGHTVADPKVGKKIADEGYENERREKYSPGAYADAGKGAIAEQAIEKANTNMFGDGKGRGPFNTRPTESKSRAEANAKGGLSKFKSDMFPGGGNDLSDEIKQITAGVNSKVAGKGYKRGYNDKYYEQVKEQQQADVSNYHRNNPTKPFGQFTGEDTQRQLEAEEREKKKVKAAAAEAAAGKKLDKIKTNEKFNKGAMKRGGARRKKQLGGIMGAIGGAKDGGGIGGALKGALGGGMFGRLAGAVGGLKDGGGLQGAMQGFKGGAFGNSNPMGGGAGGAGGAPGTAGNTGATSPYVNDAAADPNKGQLKKGGLRDRRKAKTRKRSKK